MRKLILVLQLPYFVPDFSAGSYFTFTETGEIVLDTKLACLIMFQSLLRGWGGDLDRPTFD